jgi:uncharacterized protein (DUF58 family)
VDLSGSEQFGTRGRFKAELAAELAAVLALSAVRNNDRVGLHHLQRPHRARGAAAQGAPHALRLIRDVLAFRPAGRGTDIAGALDYAARLLAHRGIIFLLSDFAPRGVVTTEERRGGRRRCASCRAVTTSWHLHRGSRRAGTARHRLVALEDPETGELAFVDTSGDGVRDVFGVALARERIETRRLFRRLGVDEIEVRTDVPYVRPLLAFFHRRERKRRR